MFVKRSVISLWTRSKQKTSLFHSSAVALQFDRSRNERFHRFGGGSDRNSSRGTPRQYQLDMDSLSFKKTVKVDPEFKLPIADMQFTEPTRKALENKGFSLLTPIQSQSYQVVVEGNDVVARSRTGTGKTLAFGIPLIEQLIQKGLNVRKSRAKSPLIVIMEPTRELAIQVADELAVIAKPHGLRVLPVFGGSSFSRQESALRNGIDIIVATPGRLIDHINQQTINLSSVATVVLDEGDLMLEMGFQDDVETILKAVRKPASSAEDNNTSAPASPVQMMLFSATMPSWICKLTDRLMKEPVFLDAVQEGETRLAPTITHYSVLLPESMERFEAVLSYLEDLILTRGHAGQTIVFTNTKDEANRIANSDCFGHLSAQVLHGDISQETRQHTLRAFREKKVDILVATDVAARGLDISGVELVVHISPPRDADSYVHRSGRTGRAGRPGTALLFYSKSEQYLLRSLQRSLKFDFVRIGPPTPDAICEASANIVTNKLGLVDQETVDYFLPHARKFLEEVIVHGKVYGSPAITSDETQTTVTEPVNSQEALEDLFARCIASISQRYTITSRSMLTGKEGMLTLKFTGAIQSYRDIASYLANDLQIERYQRSSNDSFLRSYYARNEDENGRLEEEMHLVDVDQELAKFIVAKANELAETKNKSKITVTLLNSLPDYVKYDQYSSSSSSSSPSYNNRYDSRDGGRVNFDRFRDRGSRNANENRRFVGFREPKFDRSRDFSGPRDRARAAHRY